MRYNVKSISPGVVHTLFTHATSTGVVLLMKRTALLLSTDFFFPLKKQWTDPCSSTVHCQTVWGNIKTWKGLLATNGLKVARRLPRLHFLDTLSRQQGIWIFSPLTIEKMMAFISARLQTQLLKNGRYCLILLNYAQHVSRDSDTDSVSINYCNVHQHSKFWRHLFYKNCSFQLCLTKVMHNIMMLYGVLIKRRFKL